VQRLNRYTILLQPMFNILLFLLDDTPKLFGGMHITELVINDLRTIGENSHSAVQSIVSYRLGCNDKDVEELVDFLIYLFSQRRYGKKKISVYTFYILCNGTKLWVKIHFRR